MTLISPWQVDCPSSSPLPDGPRSQKPQCAAESDSEGHFSFPALPPGQYTLVSSQGSAVGLCGCVAVWLCGCVAQAMWLCGCVAVWLRLCGCVAVWLCGSGCVAVWLCGSGYVAVWLCGSGYVAVWLCGCVAVWLRLSTCTGVAGYIHAVYSLGNFWVRICMYCTCTCTCM